MAESLEESIGVISESEKRFMERFWSLSHQELYWLVVRERREKAQLLDAIRRMKAEQNERE